MKNRAVFLGILVALCIALSLGVFLLPGGGDESTALMKLKLMSLGSEAVLLGMYGTPPLSFPIGESTADLRQWMLDRGSDSRSVREETLWKDGQLQDFWGRPVQYRFPSRRRELLLELYSCGPNGLDEGGLGDDVTGDNVLSFDRYREKFAKPEEANAEWLWRHYGHLEWNTEAKIDVVSDSRSQDTTLPPPITPRAIR